MKQKPKGAKRKTARLDTVSLVVGLVGGAAVVLAGRAIAAMPVDQQAELLKAIVAALQKKTLPAGAPASSSPAAAAEISSTHELRRK